MRLYRFRSTPANSASAGIGACQSLREQLSGDLLSLRIYYVGEDAAVVFRAGDVGDLHLVAEMAGEGLAGRPGHLAFRRAPGLRLRRVDAAQPYMDAQVLPGPEFCLGQKRVAVQNLYDPSADGTLEGWCGEGRGREEEEGEEQGVAHDVGIYTQLYT